MQQASLFDERQDADDADDEVDEDDTLALGAIDTDWGFYKRDDSWFFSFAYKGRRDQLIEAGIITANQLPKKKSSRRSCGSSHPESGDWCVSRSESGDNFDSHYHVDAAVILSELDEKQFRRFFIAIGHTDQSSYGDRTAGLVDPG
ncbi:MAG: hypothetical protein HYX63_16625 [Gammaproteobacteria bacterium]|nr:hypothetical protein [Gammaproteobacteria bacterium]